MLNMQFCYFIIKLNFRSKYIRVINEEQIWEPDELGNVEVTVGIQIKGDGESTLIEVLNKRFLVEVKVCRNVK